MPWASQENHYSLRAKVVRIFSLLFLSHNRAVVQPYTCIMDIGIMGDDGDGGSGGGDKRWRGEWWKVEKCG